MNCKHCGEEFNKRADAKFCSSVCRSAHNNKSNQFNATVVRCNKGKEHIEQILSNRKIIMNAVAKGTSTCSLSTLLLMKIDLKYTSKREVVSGNTYYNFFDAYIMRYANTNACDIGIES